MPRARTLPDALAEYRRRRRFSQTPEPAGGAPAAADGRRFVVQKHAARRLHYDLRLELDGVLKSWAVPKGPSLDPSEKRLAVEVEDHPVEYAGFEGVIPAGEYGGGTVLVWDQGTWEPEGDPVRALEQGRLTFRLEGEKLRGRWNLVRTRGRQDGDKNWLLIKGRDDQARSADEFDVLGSAASVASGRTIEQVAADRDRVWQPKHNKPETGRSPKRAKRDNGRRAGARQKAKAIARGAGLPGAERAEMPAAIAPALATLAAAAPPGDEWLHEIKFDGYRLLCFVEKGQAKLISRNNLDWTHRFPSIAAAAAELPVERAVLDGEAIVLMPNGTSSFQALQSILRGGRSGRLVYQCFDLLYLDGYDLRGVPLENRKQHLAELLAGAEGDGALQYTEHVVGSGPEFHHESCRLGLEGVISKRRRGSYPRGRNTDWLKVKCIQSHEFVIGGFTESTAHGRALGSLLLGYYDGGQFRYAGRVGTGFGEATLADLRRRLDSMRQADPPFADAPARKDRQTHWVRPELVAQITFTDWTEDHLLRHPSFQGLREDKPARSVQLERAATPGGKQSGRAQAAKKTHRSKTTRQTDPQSVAAGVRLSHPDRVLYQEQGITKLGLATYYVEIADWILPHVAHRPLSLFRCPEGQKNDCFFQKHVRPGTPEALGRVEITERSKKQQYLVVESAAGLVALVQMGVLEIHPWGARSDDVERPDRLVFDLDPGPGVPWSRVIEAAHQVRDRLDRLGLACFVKTTGGKGLHVVVPLRRRAAWPEAKAFAKAVAERMAGDLPTQFTTTMAKAARPGKIFLDYLRNDRGATSVAPFSTRAKPGAPVSTPLAWEELRPAIRSDHFTVENLPRRLASLSGDPWEGFTDVRQSLTASVLGRVK